MNLIRKQYKTLDDYWRARDFLRGLSGPGARVHANWHVCDLDYWRWHFMENVWERPMEELRLWETPTGELAAILVQGEPGVCHLTAGSAHRSRGLLLDMVDTAEAVFSADFGNGRNGVVIWTQENDELLCSVLEERGFGPPPEGRGTDFYGSQTLPAEPDSPVVPQGYVVRSMGDTEEHPARSLASWRAFHPGEPTPGPIRRGPGIAASKGRPPTGGISMSWP